jgi:hypothetical protein
MLTFLLVAKAPAQSVCHCHIFYGFTQLQNGVWSGSSQASKCSLDLDTKIIVIGVLLIFLVHDFDFEFLACLEDVVDEEGLFEIRFEGVVDGLSLPMKVLMVGRALEEDLDVGSDLEKMSMSQSPFDRNICSCAI